MLTITVALPRRAVFFFFFLKLIYGAMINKPKMSSRDKVTRKICRTVKKKKRASSHKHEGKEQASI